MEAHGGDIGVYSDGHAGSTFFVDIPIVEGRISGLPSISQPIPECDECSTDTGTSAVGRLAVRTVNYDDDDAESESVDDSERSAIISKSSTSISKECPADDSTCHGINHLRLEDVDTADGRSRSKSMKDEGAMQNIHKPHWKFVLLVDDCTGIRKITTRSLATSVDIDVIEEVRNA